MDGLFMMFTNNLKKIKGYHDQYCPTIKCWPSYQLGYQIGYY